MPDVAMPLIEAWENPPQPGAGRRRSRSDERPWYQAADAMRERAGDWARLAPHVPLQTAYDINNARLSAFRPAGTFEAVTRDGRVYARFVDGGLR